MTMMGEGGLSSPSFLPDSAMSRYYTRTICTPRKSRSVCDASCPRRRGATARRSLASYADLPAAAAAKIRYAPFVLQEGRSSSQRARVACLQGGRGAYRNTDHNITWNLEDACGCDHGPPPLPLPSPERAKETNISSSIIERRSMQFHAVPFVTAAIECEWTNELLCMISISSLRGTSRRQGAMDSGEMNAPRPMPKKSASSKVRIRRNL